MNSLNQQIKLLFNEQVSNWELARVNFNGLQNVQTKTFDFGDFEVRVQFNPARIVSSGAKVDAQSIAERKCFLCESNRPTEQRGFPLGDYDILVNPFPIFPAHYTIPRREHVPQQILPFITDMLFITRAMDNYLLFYNGPQCGASAPDHMHFQAGSKDFLPLVNDYKRLKNTHASLLVTTEKHQLYQVNNYLRTYYCIESTDSDSLRDAFEKLYTFLTSLSSGRGDGGEVAEPLMNVVCLFEDKKWYLFVIPRKAFRPWQYTAEGNAQLLISPATVEMCGVIITPVEAHFNRITQKDIENIYYQVAY